MRVRVKCSVKRKEKNQKARRKSSFLFRRKMVARTPTKEKKMAPVLNPNLLRETLKKVTEQTRQTLSSIHFLKTRPLFLIKI